MDDFCKFVLKDGRTLSFETRELFEEFFLEKLDVEKEIESFRKNLNKIIKNKQREILKKKYSRCVINRDKTKLKPEFEKDGIHLKVDENRIASYIGEPLEVAYMFAQVLHEIEDDFQGFKTKLLGGKGGKK